MELIDRLRGKKYYIKLDFRGVYNLIYIKEGEEWKTAFQIKYRHYKYTIISFKLINAPVIIQNLINNTLKEYLDKFYIIYLNNILIFLDNKREYKEHIIIVLKILKRAKL